MLSAASSEIKIPKGLPAIAATMIITIKITKTTITPIQPKAAKNAAAAFVTAAAIALPIAATAFAVFIATALATCAAFIAACLALFAASFAAFFVTSF